MKFFFFKFILFFTAALPLKTIHQLGVFMGVLSWKSNSRIRRIAEKNIQLCFPELDSLQQNALVKKTLGETGKVILETGKMWSGNTASTLSLVKEVENQHLIDTALKNKRGVIIAMPHYGSWEIASLYCANHYPMTTMYAPQPDEKINQLIQQARQRTGATLVPTDNSGIRALSKALKQGEAISILPDQSPKNNGMFAPFFGHACYTMTLLSKLANKNNACVIFTYAKRLEDDSGFKLVFREASRDLATLPLEESVVEMNLNIEKLIRETPHQYQWTYKRFKEQPKGAPSVY